MTPTQSTTTVTSGSPPIPNGNGPDRPPAPELDQLNGVLDVYLSQSARPHRERLIDILQVIESTASGSVLLDHFRERARQGNALVVNLQPAAGPLPDGSGQDLWLNEAHLTAPPAEIGVPPEFAHAPAVFRALLAARQASAAHAPPSVLTTTSSHASPSGNAAYAASTGLASHAMSVGDWAHLYIDLSHDAHASPADPSHADALARFQQELGALGQEPPRLRERTEILYATTNSNEVAKAMKQLEAAQAAQASKPTGSAETFPTSSSSAPTMVNKDDSGKHGPGSSALYLVQGSPPSEPAPPAPSLTNGVEEPRSHTSSIADEQSLNGDLSDSQASPAGKRNTLTRRAGQWFVNRFNTVTRKINGWRRGRTEQFQMAQAQPQPDTQRSSRSLSNASRTSGGNPNGGPPQP